MRAAIYVRVSTIDQNLDNQLDDLQAYVRQRGWEEAVVCSGRVSGAKDRRPGLDDLLKAARRRQFDAGVLAVGQVGTKSATPPERPAGTGGARDRWCSSGYLREETLSQLLAEVVGRVQITAEQAEWIARALLESQGDKEREHRRAALLHQQRYQQVQNLLDRAYDDRLKGTISDEM